MSFAHKRELIANHDGEWGIIDDFMTSADNRKIAYKAIENIGASDENDEIVHLICNGNCVQSLRKIKIRMCSLSFDASKFAFITEPYIVYEDEQCEVFHYCHDVYINGQLAYTVPFDYVDCFAWISNDELVWRCSNIGKGSRRETAIKCFVNGIDVTGKMMFGMLWDYYGSERGIVTRVEDYEEMKQYIVDWEGVEKEERYCNKTECVNCECQALEKASIHYDESNRWYHIRFKGADTPLFRDIPSYGNFAYTADRSRVAYAGIRYPWWAEASWKIVPPSVIDSILDKAVDGSIVANAIMFPISFFYNPYDGHLTVRAESGKKYYMVDHGEPWKLSFEYIESFFYTPNGNLVANVIDREGFRVVIDGSAGPKYDAIYKVRFIEGKVCYIGFRKNKFYRIEVEV